MNFSERICLYSPPLNTFESYYQVVDFAKKHNLTKIEAFSMFELSEPCVNEAKKLFNYASKKGVSFVCMSIFIDLAGSDNEKMTARAKAFADVAKELGARFYHYSVIPQNVSPDAVIHKGEELLNKGSINSALVFDYAKSIGLEPVFEEQGFIVNGIENYRRFLNSLKRTSGVLLDFANIYQMGESVDSFASAVAKKTVHAHIKDVTLLTKPTDTSLGTLDGRFMVEVTPGSGVVPIEKCIEILEKSGYIGYYSLEWGFAQSEDEFMSVIHYISKIIEKYEVK